MLWYRSAVGCSRSRGTQVSAPPGCRDPATPSHVPSRPPGLGEARCWQEARAGRGGREGAKREEQVGGRLAGSGCGLRPGDVGWGRKAMLSWERRNRARGRGKVRGRESEGTPGNDIGGLRYSYGHSLLLGRAQLAAQGSDAPVYPCNNREEAVQSPRAPRRPRAGADTPRAQRCAPPRQPQAPGALLLLITLPRAFRREQGRGASR